MKWRLMTIVLFALIAMVVFAPNVGAQGSTPTATPTVEPPLLTFCAAGICDRTVASVGAVILELRTSTNGGTVALEMCNVSGATACIEYSVLGTLTTNNEQGVDGVALVIVRQSFWYRATIGAQTITFYIPVGALNWRVVVQ